MNKRLMIIVGIVAALGIAGFSVISWVNRDQSFNDRDVAFASNMVPHHVGALEMTEVILAKDDIPADVRDLAARIEATQQPEIDLMNEWLESWGYEARSGGHDAHGGHSMMSGMMSPSEMFALENAQGREAARLFLEGMIVHHKGAVEMAQVEIDRGKSEEAVALARVIIEQQNSEIAEMEALLRDL